MTNTYTGKWSRLKLFKFSLILIFILLLISEAALRIVFHFKFRGLHTSVYIQGSPIQTDDNLTVYNNRPYYVDYQKEFQYNEWGMKSATGDVEMPVKKKNDLWVILFGGSAMEGMGSNKDGKWFDITNVTDHPYSENIAAYLQNALQPHYPGRTVKVFNAAVSGYNIRQGFARYKELSKHYDFDWVISMDGVNEPPAVEGNEPEFYFSKTYWSKFPFKEFPLKYIIPVTQHSALCTILKQEFYYLRLKGRMARNEKNGFPERAFWLKQPTLPLAFAPSDIKVKKATDKFITEIHRFEALLKQQNKKYLFLVQPYLPFRDSLVLTPEEKALNNYMRSTYQNKYNNQFLKNVCDTVDVISATNPNIQNMKGLNSWQGWTLVDYCHFTQMANKKIAGRLADFIMKNGNIEIFKN